MFKALIITFNILQGCDYASTVRDIPNAHEVNPLGTNHIAVKASLTVADDIFFVKINKNHPKVARAFLIVGNVLEMYAINHNVRLH